MPASLTENQITLRMIVAYDATEIISLDTHSFYLTAQQFQTLLMST